MVLLLGNHSAGKSSFINHILGSEVQISGRSPSDSKFTVIQGGNRNETLDGKTLSRQPDFTDLEKLFGSSFLPHIESKIVNNCEFLDELGIIVCDSPGMIDPPGMLINGNTSHSELDRGYNFKGVLRWLSQRSDVILLFFDPDKPGTTFETLDILANCLKGMTRKVHIILNKVDGKLNSLSALF